MAIENESLRLKLEHLERRFDGQFKIVFDALRRIFEVEDEPSEIGFKTEELLFDKACFFVIMRCMFTKTPQFDAVIDEFFSQLVPGERTCPETGESWDLTAKDIERYREFRVPPSKLVPWARIRRLRASIGGYDLFKRMLPDGKTLITMYDPESPVELLPTGDWMNKRSNDAFLANGQEYDSSKSFFEQWITFSRSIPRPAVIQDSKNENSDWSSYSVNCKNNYQCYCNSDSQDLLYCDCCSGSSYSSDIFAGDKQEWCYEGMRLDRCSHVFFSEWCADCVQSSFLLNCRNCMNCFGCANLSGKSYCFLNEQLTPEEYQARISAIDLSDASVVESWRRRIQEEVWNRAYRSSVSNRNVESSEGDDNIDCKDVQGIGLLQDERLLHCWGCMLSKDGADIASCFRAEATVLSTDTTNGYGYKMSYACDGCMDVEYSELLSGCEHCFGCIGLYKKRFCIFNRQYSEEEYYQRIDHIKRLMLERGEYGEFFPYESLLMSYNSSHADVLYPLTEDEVRGLGARWYDLSKDVVSEALPIDQMPEKLSETTDEILKQVFTCPVTGRPFRITKAELDLHHTLKIALPRLHPTLRRKRLMRKHRQLQFYPGTCLTCGINYKTRIKPEENLPIVCETCYQKILVGELPALKP